MDTGNNGQMIAMNLDAVAEVKVLDHRLPGRVRAVERHPDAVGDQGRHQPVPRHRVRHRAALALEQELLGQHHRTASRRRSPISETGAIRLAARSGSPAATTSCSSSTATSTGRARAATRSSNFRVPTALERQGRLLAVAGQQREPVPVHQGLDDRPALQRQQHVAAASRTAACSGRSPRAVSMPRAWRS